MFTGKRGFLVPPNDVDALAAAMRRLYDDPQEAARMGMLGRRRFETQYSIEEHMRRVLDVYAQVVNN